MSDSALYEAMREFIRATVALEVTKAVTEIRSAMPDPQVIEGPQGPAGEPGPQGETGVVNVEDLNALVDARFVELQTRTLADVFRGAWKPEEIYNRGEIALWDGSPWLMMSDSQTQAKPGSSPDWKLFAKR